MLESKLLSRQQAADYLGVKKSTLEVWASTGRHKLPFLKIGGKAMYKLADLDEFIEIAARKAYEDTPPWEN